jgi:hypothetical protein
MYIYILHKNKVLLKTQGLFFDSFIEEARLRKLDGAAVCTSPKVGLSV